MIRELPADERPRERLQARGPQSLSNADLLAILLNTGIKGEPVTAMAERLLVTFGGLGGILRADLEEIAAERGMGPAKATTLKAALELANRLGSLRSEDRPKIASPDDVFDLLGLEMAALEQEQLRVVLLDTKNHVLGTVTVYQGSANQAMVRPGEVFRGAVRRNAVGIIVVHNHPSGDPTPSGADVALTAELVKAGKLLAIEVIDHLIIGQGRHASLRRLGLGFGGDHERS